MCRVPLVMSPPPVTLADTFDDFVKNLLDPSFFIFTALWAVVIVVGTISIRQLKRLALQKHMRTLRGETGTAGGGFASLSPGPQSGAEAPMHLRIPSVLQSGELLEFMREVRTREQPGGHHSEDPAPENPPTFQLARSSGAGGSADAA